MVWIDPEFVPPTIPENEKINGTEVDANVLKALPDGVKIKWHQTYGASFWAISSKIDAILPDGQEKSYFLKVYNAGRAVDIARSEFESTKALANVIPDNVTKPVGCGQCADNPNRGFFLAEFRDMTDELPGVDDLVSLVAKIHQKESPNGKFGYDIPTYAGKHAIDNRWCDTWEEYYTRSLRDTLEQERAIHGPNEELEALSEKLLTKVVPRLIRPMETEGRRIKPVLVHGDLWHGNVSVDNETEETVVYDPCCFYGHNEYDFSMWRAPRYRTNRAHVRAYFRLVDMAEPSEDQDDRHALYAIRNDLSTSICWPANKRMREVAMEEMRILVEKYKDGYEGYIAAKKKAEEPSASVPEKLSAMPMGAHEAVLKT